MADHVQKTPERLSRLTRSSDYRTKCASGFRVGDGKHWEAHHITCNHAVEGREIAPADREYVEACLWITDWDLNNPGNLVGMPRNRQYRETDGKVPPFGPSHQVDHNTSDGYTEECKDWLSKNVWSTLKAKQKDHEVEAKAIKAQLENCTTIFKAKLVARGAREGGTLSCWANRFDPAYAARWYQPFSMGKTPRPRSPGISAADLTHVFSQIQ